ncbi:MAG: IS30 family transposase [Burkholderia sp.]
MGTYKHLSCEERTLIHLSLEQRCKLRAIIARSLHRAPSSLSRESRRNGWRAPEPAAKKGPGRPLLAGGYRGAPLAQQRARHLAGTAQQPAQPNPQGPLWATVERLLREQHFPEQIAGILRNMNPDKPTLRGASHETIYTTLYALPRGQLRAELITCLRQPHKSRQPRARGEDRRRGKIPNLVSIHDRPAEIDERIVPGHCEGDLIKGAHNASSVATLVERTSLFVTPGKMENATADAAVTSFSTNLNRIDAQRWLSLTYDQGREMAKHEQISEVTGIKIYFADPHSPWQRGRNENTNGLLHQYIPKGTDLTVFSQVELDDIACKMNTRPRKSLDWKGPAELFMPESFDVRQHHHEIVALWDALLAQRASVALRS